MGGGMKNAAKLPKIEKVPMRILPVSQWSAAGFDPVVVKICRETMYIKLLEKDIKVCPQK